MQQTILIQTDFSEDSLILIKSAIQNSAHNKLNIILVHGIHLSDSITELLFFSRSKLLKQLSNPVFEQGLAEIQSLFASSIHSLRIELFSGFNQASFNNFMSANKVNQIFVSNGYHYKKQHKMSMDISSFINKSSQQKTQLSWSRPSGAYVPMAVAH
ncbi:MAG: hypothetical protein IT256_00400 [Chitinophagaceae bacterium]|nr:hypothetical protein [Chitinophagaceae bacterium]